MGDGGKAADFQGVTDKDGKVAFGYTLVVDSEGEYDFEGLGGMNRKRNERRWIAYVEAPGYDVNCRIIELYADKANSEESYTKRNNDKYYADNKPT